MQLISKSIKSMNSLFKFLPTKDNIYNFLFNLILLAFTLLVGGYYINYQLLRINQRNVESQNLIETRNEFIKEFTELGQKRIYLAEQYSSNVKNNESNTVLDRSWLDYMNAVEDWNGHNLLNPLFLKYYFGTEYRDEFYNIILQKNLKLHTDLLTLRDGGKNVNVDKSIEDAKHELFVFSEKLIGF